MGRHVHVVDTTLRDGEQAPRVAFSAAERMELATMLAGAGIAEIEVGIPAMGEDEIEAIRGVVRLTLPTQLTCWTRAVESDILSAAACGTPFVHISFPTSRLQLELNGRDEDAQLEQVDRLVDIALREFDGVSVGALDGTRTDVDRLLAFGTLRGEPERGACASRTRWESEALGQFARSSSSSDGRSRASTSSSTATTISDWRQPIRSLRWKAGRRP